MDNFKNAMVSYRDDKLMVQDNWTNGDMTKMKGLTVNNLTDTFQAFNSYHDVWDTFHTHYPHYTYHWHEDKSATEQAFKIVGVLIQKKLIRKNMTVAEFIETVNDVAKVL